MFVEGGGGWKPPPWQPPPRKPHITKKQERLILWLVGVNVLFLLIAPIGGVTIVETVVSLLVRR